jgi:hypothetical protein
MAAPSLPTGMDPLVAQLRIIHLQASFKDLDAHALARWLTSIIFAIISPMASSRLRFLVIYSAVFSEIAPVEATITSQRTESPSHP